MYVKCVLHDTLKYFSDYVCLIRLLTLWFDYGHWPEVYEALVEGIKTIQIDTWLQVKNVKISTLCKHCV